MSMSMMRLPWAALLLFYQFSDVASNAIEHGNKLYDHQQTYNLIKNFINWHNFNANFWLVVSDDTLSDHDINFAILNDATPKIVSSRRIVNFTDTRNYAAIFLAIDHRDGIESRLNMSRELPPDVIKIYLDHNGCQLNDTKLGNIMNALWLSDEIAFIYYISFCSLSSTSNYDSIDNTQLPHEDNYNCTINLFYHQPFVKNKSGQWGALEKVDLINDLEGGRRQWSASNRVFHDFPFQRRHHLKLNRLKMTAILFPSTNAYHRSELSILRNQLSKELLDDPMHNIEAYFGMDVELLKELERQMNFTLIISPTSDRQLYGFKQANGSFNGALGDVINRRADFIMNGCFIKDYLTNLLEFTASINDDKLCIVTKTAALVPDSLLIFRVFSKSVWISIVITLIAVAFAYAILLTMIDCSRMKHDGGLQSQGKFRDKSFCTKLYRKIKGDTSILFRIIGLLLGGASQPGISTSFHERLFVSICLLWSLILCGAFQGSLYNVYSTPKSYPNIDTLDDLYKSRLDIHVRHPGLLTDIFGDAETGTTIGDLRARRLKVTTDDALNERIVSKGDVAGLARLANYDFDNLNLMPRADGKSNLHIVEQCPRSYTLGYLLRKRSIYIDTINWNINMFMQSGLVVKWQRESKYYFKLEAALKHRRLEPKVDSKVKLNIPHLQMAFVALTLGNALSALVFVVERLSSYKGK